MANLDTCLLTAVSGDGKSASCRNVIFFIEYATTDKIYNAVNSKCNKP